MAGGSPDIPLPLAIGATPSRRIIDVVTDSKRVQNVAGRVTYRPVLARSSNPAGDWRDLV